MTFFPTTCFKHDGLSQSAGDDNEDEVFRRASAAFCKAMDKEQEYDDTDAMAMGERLGDPDGRPAGNTEVRCLPCWLMGRAPVAGIVIPREFL